MDRRSGSSATSSCGIYLVNMHRVRPDQLVPRPRQLLRRTSRPARRGRRRVHRHGHAVPGPARDPRVALPEPRALHVPRPPVGVHRARLAGILRGRDRTSLRPGGRGWLLGLLPLALIVAARGRLRGLTAPAWRARRPPGRGAHVRAHGARAREHRADGAQRRPRRRARAQVQVNDAFAGFERRRGPIGRLSTERCDPHPWVEGEAYAVALVTSTGGTSRTRSPSPSRRPPTTSRSSALMALLGIYVGVSRSHSGCSGCRGCAASRRLAARHHGAHRRAARLPRDRRDVRGLGLAGEGSQAFGGAALVFIGAPCRSWPDRRVGVAGDRVRSRGRRRGAAPLAAHRARHRPAQPRRGRGDRVGLLDRRARARRVPHRRLRDPQHDRGTCDRGADGERASPLAGSPSSASSPARPRSSAPGSAPPPSTPASRRSSSASARARSCRSWSSCCPTLRDDSGRTLHPVPSRACWRHDADVRNRSPGDGLSAGDTHTPASRRDRGLREGDLLVAAARRRRARSRPTRSPSARRHARRRPRRWSRSSPSAGSSPRALPRRAPDARRASASRWR